jgi:hypothetical protein
MKRKSDDTKTDKRDIVYSHIFYQRDCEGRGEGWYFMLSQHSPYGPFPDKDVANTILEGVIKRLEAGESEEEILKKLG